MTLRASRGADRARTGRSTLSPVRDTACVMFVVKDP